MGSRGQRRRLALRKRVRGAVRGARVPRRRRASAGAAAADSRADDRRAHAQLTAPSSLPPAHLALGTRHPTLGTPLLLNSDHISAGLICAAARARCRCRSRRSTTMDHTMDVVRKAQSSIDRCTAAQAQVYGQRPLRGSRGGGRRAADARPRSLRPATLRRAGWLVVAVAPRETRRSRPHYHRLRLDKALKLRERQ